MFARAMVFLLVVLNLGAALWWATRDDVPAAEPETTVTSGVARLQLASEVPPVTERCFALGPFADAATAGIARDALPATSLRAQVREVVAAGDAPPGSLHWLDVAVVGTVDGASIRDAVAAERFDPIACAGVP